MVIAEFRSRVSRLILFTLFFSAPVLTAGPLSDLYLAVSGIPDREWYRTLPQEEGPMIMALTSAEGREQHILYRLLLADRYFRISSFDSSSQQLRLAEKYITPGQDSPETAALLLAFGKVYLQESSLDSALLAAEEGKRIGEHSNDTYLQAAAFGLLSDIHSRMEERYTAMEYLMKAIALNESEGRLIDLAANFHIMGRLLSDEGHDSSAVEYYHRALKINSRENRRLEVCKNLSGLAVSYDILGVVDSAVFYYRRSIAEAGTAKDALAAARSLSNLGNLFSRKGDLDSARNCYRLSLTVSENNRFIYGVLYNLHNIANLDRLSGDNRAAVTGFLRTENYARENDLVYDFGRIWRNLYLSYRGLDSTEQALAYLEKYTAYMDSVNVSSRHQDLMELQEKYESSEKEKEILVLEKGMLLQKMRMNTMVTFFLMSVLAASLIIYVLVRRHQAAAVKVKLSQKENERLRKELDIKNQELSKWALQSSRLQSFLKKIRIDLKNTVKLQDFRTNVPKAIEKLGELGSDKKVWSEFDRRFSEVHGDFIQRLAGEFPELQPVELRICSLLRLNLSTKEIAEMTHRSLRTIENIRFRIRKKLNLSAEENLQHFILRF